MPLFANDTSLMCVAPTEQLIMSTLNAGNDHDMHMATS